MGVEDLIKEVMDVIMNFSGNKTIYLVSKIKRSEIILKLHTVGAFNVVSNIFFIFVADVFI